MNITDILTEHAQIRPDHPAIEDGERIIGYAELDVRVSDSAANLQAAGIEVGDIVAVALPDSAEHLIILCALLRAGAVIFSLSPFLSKNAMENTLSSVSAKAVIIPKSEPSVFGSRSLTVEDICGQASGSVEVPDIKDDHPIMVIQSSGTTGEPKTCIRSHAQLMYWMRRLFQTYGWTPAERYFSLVNMFFETGRASSFGILYAGGTVVINHTQNIDELAAIVNDRKISYLNIVPSHLIPLLDYARDKAPLFPGLRTMAIGGAMITQDQRLLARKLLTSNFVELYGSNETRRLTVAMPADQDAYPDAVGRLVEEVEAQIVDSDGNLLPIGEVGEIRFRGPHYPTSYMNNPEETARAFRDGWFYPGDLAALNDEGYLFLKGRADDAINSSGALFYPIEVENALLAHPDVAEAAVFGWPHGRLGEVAAACLVMKSKVSPKELQAFCAKRIAGYKIPQIIITVKEIPRNPMGKILKDKLKDVVLREMAKQKSKKLAKRT